MALVSFPRLFGPAVVASIVGPSGGPIVKNLNLPPPAPQGPRISFRIKRTLTQEPDEGEVSIFGLAPERRLIVHQVFSETGRAKLLISGGYEGVVSQLFAGDVRSMRSNQRSGDADYALVATADDGGDSFSDLTVSYSGAQLKAQDLVDIALARFTAGDPVSLIAPYPVKPHPSVAKAIKLAGPVAEVRFPVVHGGKVTQLLDEAARILQVRWWICNGQLFMAARGLPIDETPVGLLRKHLLAEPNEDGSGLMRLEAFFDPNIAPGRLVVLKGFTTPGSLEPFRCEVAEYAGDTHAASPWRVNLVLRRFAA